MSAKIEMRRGESLKFARCKIDELVNILRREIFASMCRKLHLGARTVLA